MLKKSYHNASFFYSLFFVVFFFSLFFPPHSKGDSKEEAFSLSGLPHVFYQASTSKFGFEVRLGHSIQSMNLSSLAKENPISRPLDLRSQTVQNIRIKSLEHSHIFNTEASVLILYSFSPYHSLGFSVGAVSGGGEKEERDADAFSLVFPFLGNEVNYSFLNHLLGIKNYFFGQGRLGFVYRGSSPVFSSMNLHFGSSFYYTRQDTSHLLMHTILSALEPYQPSLDLYLGTHLKLHERFALWAKLSYKALHPFSSGNVYREFDAVENHFPYQSFYVFESGLESKWTPLLFGFYTKIWRSGGGKFVRKKILRNIDERTLRSNISEWIFNTQASLIGTLGLYSSFSVYKSSLISFGVEYQKQIVKTKLDMDVLIKESHLGDLFELELDLRGLDTEDQKYRLYSFESERKGGLKFLFNVKFEI